MQVRPPIAQVVTYRITTVQAIRITGHYLLAPTVPHAIQQNQGGVRHNSRIITVIMFFRARMPPLPAIVPSATTETITTHQTLVLGAIRLITTKPPIQITNRTYSQPIVKAVIPKMPGRQPHSIMMLNISPFTAADTARDRYGISALNAIRHRVIMPFSIASIATHGRTIRIKGIPAAMNAIRADGQINFRMNNYVEVLFQFN